MVDRPIKKSDRDAAQSAEPTEARKVPAPIKKADRTDGGPASEGSGGGRDENRGGRGKGRGKGRGRGKDDAPKAPMNPALMRGPKPTKKLEEPEAPVEVAVTDTTEVPGETPEATPDAPAAESAAPESAEAPESTEAPAEEAAPEAADDA